jgi:malate dehydrogenase (oxaloacetate-decarboxylating)(NADP+)
MESGVAQEPITDWEKYEEQLLSRMGSDINWCFALNRARINPKLIVLQRLII